MFAVRWRSERLFLQRDGRVSGVVREELAISMARWMSHLAAW